MDEKMGRDVPFTVRGLFQRAYSGGAAQCLTCHHKCLIGPGELGECRTRVNRDGVIYSMLYGRVADLSLNPIEKKPFYHFFPGSKALTFGSFGCNFTCFWCQNYGISKRYPITPEMGAYLTPIDFISQMEETGAAGTSMSLNEPTLYVEYALDVFSVARQLGKYNTFVSNGYMTSEVVEALIAAGLDAINIDIKGHEYAVQKYCEANLRRVWQNVKRFRDAGIHVELTTLVIPGINDDPEAFEELCSGVRQWAGTNTPWHLTRFHPAWQAPDRGITTPTPVKTLDILAARASEAGFQYVYVGNVPGHNREHTRCPRCGKTLIRRAYPNVWNEGVTVTGEKGYCKACGHEIPGRWCFSEPDNPNSF